MTRPSQFNCQMPDFYINNLAVAKYTKTLAHPLMQSLENGRCQYVDNVWHIDRYRQDLTHDICQMPDFFINSLAEVNM